MPIQPSQVVSRSNSDLCRITAVMDNRSTPPAKRMAEIYRIAEEFRLAVKGSTHDPLRGVNP